jgi:NTP pyrophosphatase (non-canonical NTP hydrolase)
MTFDDYQQQALVTEAPIDDGVRQRFRECSGMIYSILKEPGYNLPWVDPVKKYVFYGKAMGRDDWYVVEDEAKYLVPSYLSQSADETIRLVHGFLGILSEIPELAEAILKQDKVNVAEETFDISWYQAVIMDSQDLLMDMGATANIQKLRLRYPDKFSQYDAQNRDIEWERESLESNLSD